MMIYVESFPQKDPSTLADRILDPINQPFSGSRPGIGLRESLPQLNRKEEKHSISWLTGKCSEPGAHQSRKTCVAPQACRSDRRWRFFPLYGCGKNTTAWMIALTGGAGRLQSFRRWAGSFSAFVPIPSRPSPWLRTNRPDTTSPGRQDRRNYLLIQPTRLY